MHWGPPQGIPEFPSHLGTSPHQGTCPSWSASPDWSASWAAALRVLPEIAGAYVGSRGSPARHGQVTRPQRVGPALPAFAFPK